MLKRVFLIICAVSALATACKTIDEHSASVATNLEQYDQLVAGTLVDTRFANVTEENKWIKLNQDGEVINTLPKESDEREAVLSGLLAELTAPGVFDGSQKQEFQIVIHSMFWEDDLSLGGVLIGAHSASSKGAYSLLDGTGKVLRSDTVESSADASLDDAFSVIGRKQAARLKAVLSNFHKYREILVANAEAINDAAN